MANAALGEFVPPSATKDQRQQKPGTESYSVRETEIPGGQMREYISGDGLVFAVTWQGVKPANLSEILGGHFREFEDARSAQGRGPGRKPVGVQTRDLVVLSGGHMRDHRGRAYLPNRLPRGVSAVDLP